MTFQEDMYQSDHDYYGRYACASVHVCVLACVGLWVCMRVRVCWEHLMSSLLEYC